MRLAVIIAGLLFCSSPAAASGGVCAGTTWTDTPTNTYTPTITQTPTATNTATNTPTNTATYTPTPTFTPTFPPPEINISVFGDSSIQGGDYPGDGEPFYSPRLTMEQRSLVLGHMIGCVGACAMGSVGDPAPYPNGNFLACGINNVMQGTLGRLLAGPGSWLANDFPVQHGTDILSLGPYHGDFYNAYDSLSVTATLERNGNEARAQHPNLRIVFLGYYIQAGKTAEQEAANSITAQVVTNLGGSAAGFYFIDVRSVFDPVTWTPSALFDGLHPTKAANDFMGTQLADQYIALPSYP